MEARNYRNPGSAESHSIDTPRLSPLFGQFMMPYQSDAPVHASMVFRRTINHDILSVMSPCPTTPHARLLVTTSLVANTACPTSIGVVLGSTALRHLQDSSS